MTLFVDKIASGKGILHHVDAGHLAVMSIYSGNLPFERAYRYLERERIAKAVLFLYTKIVAVFPYTVGDGRKYGYYSINPAFMRVTGFILP